ncbi:Uncharacterized membrane-anchored protein [Actinobacillus indolicus]|nr:Uncharacterized membrane-anchored protein [Actinobacillus indolicus]VTU06988.1 Uncharacterized membrane-anchored protein [Actinobacillus indolicus]
MNLLNQSWEKYLRFIFMLLAVGLFSSGVVTFIASNWELLTKFQKLYGVQTLLVAVTLLAVWIYHRESRQGSTVKSYALFFVSLIVIGALLALIGQIYQTGADPWQLFALWTLLQLPLLLCLPNIAGALLFLATLNIALLRYQFVHHIDASFIIGANLLLLAVIEATKSRLYDPWLVVNKIQNVILVAVLGWFVVENTQLIPITWLISIGLLWFYRTRRLDLFNLSVHLAYLIASVNVWLLDQLELGGLMFSSLITLFALLFVAYYVKKSFGAYLSQRQSHLAVQLLYLFLIALGTGMLVLCIALFVVQDEAYTLLFTTAILLIPAFAFRKKENYLELSAICFLVASGTWTAFCLFLDISSWMGLTLSITASVIVYLINQQHWVRTVVVLQILFILFEHFYAFNDFYSSEYEHEMFFYHFFSSYSFYWLSLGSLICFYWMGRTRFDLRPMAWGFLLFYVYFVFSKSLFSYHVEADELPQINTFSDFFHLATFDLFNRPWDIHSFLSLVASLYAIVTFLLLHKAQQRPIHWLIAIGILFLSISFISVPLLIFCIALLLFAYTKQSQPLFVFSLVIAIASLAEYYYSLKLPLLYKSYLLLSVGVVFSLIVISLYRQYPEQQEHIQGHSLYTKRIPVTALVTLILTLGIAQFTIHQNEDVLENGESIVLKLAPRDPRSIMQGDYMELHYELLNQVGNALPNEEMTNSKAYALLTLDEQRIATLCRIEFEKPQHFDGCAQGIYLPVTLNSYGDLSLPTQQFFFPEGKGEYFNQAEYGEYRFKEGKALLLRLLNTELEAL